MKKLIFLLLLPLSVSAQIPGRLDSLQLRMCRLANKPTTYTSTWTSALLWQSLTDAQTPVCQDFDAFEKFDTVLVYKVPEGGTLNNDFLRVAWVDRMSGSTRLPMQPIEAVNRWTATGGTIAGSTIADVAKIEQPRYYFVHGNRLMTHPKDGQESTRRDSLLVGYWAIASPLTGASDSTDIYPEFRPALLYKALSLALSAVGSYGESAAWEGQYAKEVALYGREKKK